MTSTDEQRQLGQFFHTLRVNRGVTLQAAAGSWSPATLSRFERGQQDLATDKAITLMARLGIEQGDFFTFYQAQPGNFPMTILNYALSYDSVLVTQWRQRYFSLHPEATAITAYAAVLFDAASHWHARGYRFTAAQEQLLADRLAVPERWKATEANALKLIVGPASRELLDLLRRRAERLAPSHPLRDMRLLIIWLGALMNRDRALVDDLQAQLTAVFTRPEASPIVTQYYSNWQFGVAAAAWLRDPTPAREAAISQMIQDLLAMNNRDDAFWFQNMFARMRTGRVHHNPSLIDHPLAAETCTTAGEIIREQRRIMGVSVADVARTISATTLRRFEAGHTQLGFSALVGLMGELGLMPSQVLAVSGAGAAAGNLFALALQLPNLSKPEAEAKIATFESQTADYPAPVRGMQQFILRSARPALTTTTQMQAAAPAIMTALLNAQVWYRQELMAVQAVAKWLPVDQLRLLFTHGQHLFEKNPPMVGVITLFFDALSQALVRVVASSTPQAGSAFVHDLRWLTRVGKETPGSWLATGAWLVADAVTAPTPKKTAAVHQYLQRSKRVGHVEAIAALRHDWQALAPNALLMTEA